MFVLLLLLWVILNGKITVEILVTGLVLVAVISYFMYQHLGYTTSTEGNFFRRMGWGLWFFGIVILEVIKSGLAVLKFVVAKDMDIQPQIVIFPVALKSHFLRIVLSHVITLTPGTITLQVEGNLFYVHAFDYTFAEDVVDSAMTRALLKIEADLEQQEGRNNAHD